MCGCVRWNGLVWWILSQYQFIPKLKTQCHYVRSMMFRNVWWGFVSACTKNNRCFSCEQFSDVTSVIWPAMFTPNYWRSSYCSSLLLHLNNYAWSFSPLSNQLFHFSSVLFVNHFNSQLVKWCQWSIVNHLWRPDIYVINLYLVVEYLPIVNTFGRRN